MPARDNDELLRAVEWLAKLTIAVTGLLLLLLTEALLVKHKWNDLVAQPDPPRLPLEPDVSQESPPGATIQPSPCVPPQATPSHPWRRLIDPILSRVLESVEPQGVRLLQAPAQAGAASRPARLARVHRPHGRLGLELTRVWPISRARTMASESGWPNREPYTRRMIFLVRLLVLALVPAVPVVSGPPVVAAPTAAKPRTIRQHQRCRRATQAAMAVSP